MRMQSCWYLLADHCIACENVGVLDHGEVGRRVFADLQYASPLGEVAAVLLVLCATFRQTIKTCTIRSWSHCYMGKMLVEMPPESSAEPLWGSTLTPLRTPRFHFLAKPVYLCTYAAYASIETDVIQFSKLFHGTNLATPLPAIIASRQSKLWPPPVIWQIQPWKWVSRPICKFSLNNLCVLHFTVNICFKKYPKLIANVTR